MIDPSYKNPTPEDNKGWTTLLATLRFDGLEKPIKDEIKQMIYDESTCLENDFPVTSLMTCAPIRFIIHNILMELLRSGKTYDSMSQVTMKFKPKKYVEELSKSAKAVEEAAEEARVREAAEEAARVEAAEGAAAEGAGRGGARKARKRRILRSHT